LLAIGRNLPVSWIREIVVPIAMTSRYWPQAVQNDPGVALRGRTQDQRGYLGVKDRPQDGQGALPGLLFQSPLVDKTNERIVVFVGNVDVSLASVKMHRTTIFPDT
jgi:hypothetical protein